MPFSLPFGSLAQWSEQPAHNRQVPGSSPGGSTGSRMCSCCLNDFHFIGCRMKPRPAAPPWMEEKRKYYDQGERIGVSNPRYANGNLRRKHRARLKAQGGPCGICRGRLGPIHYEEPSDSEHPLSFVVDEIKPISRCLIPDRENGTGD